MNNVLVVGGGTGKLITALTKTGKMDHITYLDISDKMVQRAKNRHAHNVPIDFICGTISELPPDRLYDLIITPYFLDCLQQKEMEATVSNLAKLQKENGIWLFSDFQYSQKSGFWRWCSQIIIHSLYLFFRIFCGLKNKQLPDFQKSFIRSGYMKQQQVHFAKGMLQTVWFQKNAIQSPASE